jgi:hypothetical protein
MTRRPVQIPLLPSRCPADVSAVVGPVVMGDDRGPWRWAVRGGPSGMAATWQEAWARVDEVRS